MTEEKKEVPLGMREWIPDGGTLVAEALVEHGVTVAFGVQGGHIWPMVDEMSRAGIKNITFTHEQSAAYAADGYAKVTRRPAVAYATVGPGVANAVSGIQQDFFGGARPQTNMDNVAMFARFACQEQQRCGAVTTACQQVTFSF